MNDKCAAGTGRFLEVMANALEIDLAQMGELALLSKREVYMASVCTVFAESEVISLLSEGCDKADIIAGIYRAIANRIMGLVIQVGLRKKVAMSGGCQKPGHDQSPGRPPQCRGTHPDEPQIIGALGAAILAAERAVRERERVPDPAAEST